MAESPSAQTGGLSRMKKKNKQDVAANLTNRRRWVRVALRAAIALFAALGIWIGWQTRWIRERHELLSKQQSLVEEAAKGRFGEPVSQGRSTRGQRDWTAEQAALWLLGERRFDEVRLVLFTDDSQSPDREVDRAERLFPETAVFRWEEYRRSPVGNTPDR